MQDMRLGGHGADHWHGSNGDIVSSNPVGISLMRADETAILDLCHASLILASLRG